MTTGGCVVKPTHPLDYCRGMPSDLTPEQINLFSIDHPDWIREGKSISRTYVFADFNEAMGFVTRVAIASEAADHHPDINIRFDSFAQ
jgi:4a-hydroxytetrahydrobiopterin dehydratase